jgi:hypothetical protein
MEVNLMTNSDSNSYSLEHVVFLVENEPYCLWSYKSIKERTLEFLYGIHPNYFAYQADTNLKRLNTKKYREHAALAIRIAYSHGLETLFSLLCAAIQAPYCIPGWLLRCSNDQLYSIVKKINSHEYVPSWLKLGRLNWQKVSSVIYKPLYLEEKEEGKFVISQFAEVWSNWALEFSRETLRKEYNSIKHGFRVAPGGFSFLIGPGTTPGIENSGEDFKLLGGSEFGSNFFDYLPVGKLKGHIQLRGNSNNWDPEQMAWRLHLISISISNIVSYLKLVNGVSADKVVFILPKETQTFQDPFQESLSMGAQSIGIFTNIPAQTITNYSKADLKALYKKGKVLHRKIVNINAPQDVGENGAIE